MEQRIERALLAARWLLLPFYALLLLSLTAIYIMVGREALLLVEAAFAPGDTDLILILLAILDLTLIANLLVMVAVSSFESYVSKIEVHDGSDKPEWLGKLDSGNVKIKISLSIVMISAIHLLRAFMTETATERLIVLAGVHLVFVVSALLLAFVDRAARGEAASG
jgi:uncharacterized protein (TIGR00645 family)